MADEKSKDGASAAGGKTNPDTVAPGEDDPDAEKNKLDFDRSVGQMQSAISGVGGREKWGSKTQFLMSCIASAVGLGNVWRFPAICAVNGGAAFLIPYAIVLTIIARPLFVLELTLGQFSSKGSVRCWDVSPIFTGIGVAGCVSSVLLSTFYIMLLAWSLIYSIIAFVSICYNPTGTPIWTNETERFFGVEVLQALNFDDPRNMDIVTWKPICHLVLALMFAWGLIWITMVFGVEASGKVAYVTALAPYFVLILLLIAGLCLPGMEVGLRYLFKPDPAKLIDGNTWFQAVAQCFFSLGIGFGGCIMFSSFNEFNNDIIKDVYIIAVIDSCTSVLAGMSLLSILGFQATKAYGDMSKNKTSEEFLKLESGCIDTFGNSSWAEKNANDKETELKECVLKGIIGVQGGAGLAFIHYPAAMNEVNNSWGHPIGTILGLLFFLMLILLAVGSANGFVGTTVTIICDKKQKWKRSNVVSGVCAFSCCLGLIYTNAYGSEWFDVVDAHGVTAVVYVLAFLEVVAVSFVYGLKNFCDDISYMRHGKNTGWYLKITWVTLPILMVIIYIYWLVEYKKNLNEHWTPTVIAIGWILTISCLLIIPITAVMKYFAFKKKPWRHNVPPTFTGILRAIKNPSPRWGPMEAEHRSGWKEFKASVEPSYHVWSRIYRILQKCRRKGGENSPLVHPTPRMSYATQAVPSEQDQSTGTGQEDELTGVKTEKPENKKGGAEKRGSTTSEVKKSRTSVASGKSKK